MNNIEIFLIKYNLWTTIKIIIKIVPIDEKEIYVINKYSTKNKW